MHNGYFLRNSNSWFKDIKALGISRVRLVGPRHRAFPHIEDTVGEGDVILNAFDLF